MSDLTPKITPKNYNDCIYSLYRLSSSISAQVSLQHKHCNSSAHRKINNQKNLNYLKVISFEKAKYEDKIVPKIICINTSSEKKELILLPESKQDILKVLPESIIMPVSISSRNNFNILNDYKIVREITENKKVV